MIRNKGKNVEHDKPIFHKFLHRSVSLLLSTVVIKMSLGKTWNEMKGIVLFDLIIVS